MHNPPNLPVWYDQKQSLQTIFQTEIFKESMKMCKGLFCLSKYHHNWLIRQNLNVPIEVLYHPTETPDVKFTFENFLNNQDKKVLQIGFWLRKLNSIYSLKTKNLRKVMLITRLDDFTLTVMEKEKTALELNINKSSVEIVNYLPNKEYDKILSENIVFINLYDSSANNVIIECVVRDTPVLVNPLPAVVEYLGKDYPFYFSSVEEASRKSDDFELIKKTHEYLKNLDKTKLSGEYFLKSFAESKIYKSLP